MTNFISKEVDKLIKKYKTRDPFEMAKGMKINICYHDLGNLKGYYFYQSKFRYIVINKNIQEELLPVICAHELGHDRFHQNYAKNDAIREFSLFDMTSKPEREANLFASELLIPDSTIMDLFNEDCTFSSVAAKLKVPVELVDFKIQILKYKGYSITPLELAKGNFLKS
jgi:Zn-dependent peptidase ImmA (M78 family)